jgi:NAD(P)-dependent dehydrogenase (short-subunit alcohol dehydrogenase family)
MSNRVALVTGGSRGIGLGCAQHLAALGFDLAINGVRAEADVVQPLEALRAPGVKVAYCRGDIGDSESRTRILEGVRRAFGRLDVLVNNAGVAPKERRDLLDATEESFDYVIGTNLRGVYFLTQAAARWMVEQRKADGGFQGCIINVSSISATVASVNRGEYCVAKAGLSMTTQLFAARLGEFGIPVYEVRPGVIRTDMTAGVQEKYDRLIADGLCVTPRWGTPDDVGRAVSALARGDFPYSTGQVIMVDGGLTLPRL